MTTFATDKESINRLISGIKTKIMNNFSFETNLEKRMPTTGKIYFVDRMTSDYADAHPFDVDAYLEEIFLKWKDCETVGFHETREDIRAIWNNVLSQTYGNENLYPNRNGERHPALIEVWLRAGDYWRRGFRSGDVLPAIIPGCNITRLDNGGWIALFPKDMHLLQSSSADNSSDAATATVPEASAEETTAEATPSPTPCEEPEPESDSEPEVAPDQPTADLSALRSIAVEILVAIVCTLVFWFSLCHASILGAGFAVAMLATASRMGLTPTMTAAALE